MWPIVRDALAEASPPIRSQICWVVALWCVLVLMQMWDSRNAEGVAGVAEFLSAVLGATGVALLGAAHTLQRTMDESAKRSRPRAEAAALQQVNVAHIHGVISNGDGSATLTLSDGSTVHVSRRTAEVRRSLET